MVRSSLRVCFFCDEYRPISPFPGGPLGVLTKQICGATEDENRNDGDNSDEEFPEPPRRMVQELTDADARTHAASPQHRARMSGVLRNREECDRVVRETRPTEHESKEKSRCMEDLKQTLRPQELHWTGSVGKSTALRGAHDLDVCVDLGPAMIGKAAVDEIETRLLGSPFVVVRKESSLVLARYGDLELDIIPYLYQSSTQDKWTSQVDNLKYFKQKDAAFKDVVRLVKAWGRLCVPVPGILIESVVDKAMRSGHTESGSSVHNLFIRAVHMLSLRLQWIDPLDAGNDLSFVLKEEMWQELHSYAKSTLDLLDVSAVQLHGESLFTFPSKHEIRLQFKPEKDIAPVDLGMLDGFKIVELCTRLALRPPSFGENASFFDQYNKPKRVKGAAKSKSQCISDVAGNLIKGELLKNAFVEMCDRLEQQKALRLPDSSPQVEQTPGSSSSAVHHD